MKLLAKSILAATIALAATPSMAGELALEANGARAHGRWGAELGAGYTFEFVNLNIRPMVGAFVYHGDSDRYNWNAQDRCIDGRDGSIESKIKCEKTDVKPYGRVEATFDIPFFAEVGGGARISSEKLRPYATVAFTTLPLVKIKANAGPKYYALGIGVDF